MDAAAEYDCAPEDICPKGGIHDMEREFLWYNYITACLCCPLYVLKECCCINCVYRSPDDDNMDGVGCRPTGPACCRKCGKSEQEVKSSVSMHSFRPTQHTTNPEGTDVLSPPQYEGSQRSQYSPSNMTRSTPLSQIAPPPYHG